jgi:outer membrane lipoprotein LolB
LRLRIQTAVVLPLLLLSVLPACSTIPPADEDEYERARLYELKFDHLAGLDDWNMNGRLAVRNEEDGGSGSFNWKHTSGDSRMDFHGALGRGAWRMTAWADGAELELADGTIHRAHSVNELVRQQLGWEIPWLAGRIWKVPYIPGHQPAGQVERDTGRVESEAGGPGLGPAGRRVPA